ncbi:SDR family NAD(P)-dependent oxidoreductase [Microbacterium schleiferi]|uniref:SDR family NAD(P)-dependent oxidoreductase n=1 Tax=Microbacterium schleiferi TaxID=69362 RepID=A0A7S8MVQ6_9MICO|nr:SDR family NAD(P)-dependent oxidoreductase [Microbacterium schleiferi]QPE03863.1 SDR family NAD(P)-dependent oxidoreductase [Microbacterium schleiferi]
MDWKWTDRGALAGRVIIVTGGSSGIGQAVAERLTQAGAHVTIAARDIVRARDVARELGPNAHARDLDLADLASVRRFAAEWEGEVDILINNAGIYSRELQVTPAGYELDFATNHLGHFALTNLLLPHITGRVVTVASQAERGSRIDLDDPAWTRRRYSPSRAYNDSKLANILFASELHRRLHAAGSPVLSVAAHPGFVRTPIYDGGHRQGWAERQLVRIAQSPDEGALPLLFAATESIPGDSFIGPQHALHMRGGAQPIGRSARAQNTELAARLWELSERATRVSLKLTQG